MDGTFEPATASTLPTDLRRPSLFVSPDGQTLLLGSGALINGSTLQAVDALPQAIDKAAWLGDQLYTANNRVADIEIVRWSTTEHTLEKSLRLPGRLLHLTPYGDDRLVLVGSRDGYLFFAVIDAALTIQSIDENRPPVRLSNLSARAHVGTGDRILIPGFIIGGSGKKKLLIRAAGPGLAQFNVAGVLPDPQMSIHDSTGATIATNDHWGDNANLADLSSVSTAVNAFQFPTGSKDASLLVSLDPGSYTVHAQGAADSTGISLVELYDADDINGSARLMNISARAQVGLGDKVLIPGIIIHGDAPAKVLIRAVGPSLSRYNVEGFLADPQLLILDRNGKAIAVNDDWGASGDPSALAATFETVDAFPLDDGGKDAALVVTLPPGSYTAHIKGANNTTGVALVEVYCVNQ